MWNRVTPVGSLCVFLVNSCASAGLDASHIVDQVPLMLSVEQRRVGVSDRPRKLTLTVH